MGLGANTIIIKEISEAKEEAATPSFINYKKGKRTRVSLSPRHGGFLKLAFRER